MAKRICWDSNVFLYYVEEDQDKLPVLDAILDQATRGQVSLFASTISIAEVACRQFEKDQQATDVAVEAALDGLWHSKGIETIGASVTIMRRARALMRSAVGRGIKVPKPMDAIILASAIYANCEELQTYDDKSGLLDLNEVFGIKVLKPNRDMQTQLVLPE